MPRFESLVCVFALAMQGASVPDHALRRVAFAVKEHRPHPEALRAVLRQASKPVKVAASHAVKRAATTPAEDARLDLSRRFRSAHSDAVVQSFIRNVQGAKNDTSRIVLEPTISEAQDALQMIESVRTTLEEVSGLQQVSEDPVKSRASLATEIAEMEGLVNSTDGSKWKPLLSPTIKAARQAFEELGVPENDNSFNASGASISGSTSTSTTPEPTELPAMPYKEDELLDNDFPWDDGYMTQYENQTSGDAINSLPPPPGTAAAAVIAPGDGAVSSQVGAGPVSLGHSHNEKMNISDQSAKNLVYGTTNLDMGNGTSSIASSQRPLVPLGRSATASDHVSSWMHA